MYALQPFPKLRQVTPALLGLALLSTLCSLPASASTLTSADATGLNLGTDADYIFVDLGPTNLGWNAYQLDGNVLFGQGLNVSLSGGNNGGLGTGDAVYTDNPSNISGSLSNPITVNTVSSSVTLAAKNTANSVAAFAAGLPADPGHTYGNITGATTFTANGSLTVIDVGNIQNAPITISGAAGDFFVINVSGQDQTNQAVTLTGGVTAADILWNFTGTGTVLQTSGGDVLDGTYLATDGGAYQFSELDLNGALINTDGNIQLVSGQQTLTGMPFSIPSTVVPEPSSLLLLGTGLLGLGGMVRRKLFA